MNDLEKKRQQIRNLMRYAVPAEQLEQALDLLLVFREDSIALMVLEEFYTYLPEGKEDHIKELRLIGRKNGMFLLAAVSQLDAYLYLASSEGLEFHGSLKEGYLDRELRKFFGFSSSEDFELAAKNLDQFALYQPLQTIEELCPACHVAIGELHELGCPVEICPWCGGQLIHCHCRFEHLGVEEITNEQDIIRFEALLEEQGRQAYSPEQRPHFADEGPGIEIL